MASKNIDLPSSDHALAGRDMPIMQPGKHFVLDRPIGPPFPDNTQVVLLGLGCFWGAEKLFWPLDGVYTTAVGYAAGITPNPTYQEVCSGMTGHNEVVLVVYDQKKIDFKHLLEIFWESHYPTQGMRQGNDVGTQYRSGIYYSNSQQQTEAERSMQHFQARLSSFGYPSITTEIQAMTEFYYAEEYHQQYLAKNPAGYCGLGGTGVSFE